MRIKKADPIILACATLLVVLAFLAVFGQFLTPHDPDSGSLRDALESPSRTHPLGTDYLGRDTLSRVIAGTRVAAIAGIEATSIALIVGVTFGMSIGLAGGWVDRIGMRFVEGMSSIPAIVLAIAVIAALGSGLTRSMLAVGLAFAMSIARLARGLTLAERERVYVDGAIVVGSSRTRLLTRHIAPNVAGPIVVQATLIFASAIVIEASLSFLGLGVQPPASSWGNMLSAAQRTIRESRFQAIPPGVAIVLTVLAINVIGDNLIRRRRGDSYSNPTGFLVPVSVGHSSTTDHDSNTRTETETSENLLNARALRVVYGSNVAVDDVDIHIAEGEVAALIGESGSGKTSVAMSLAGLIVAPAVVTAAEVGLRAAGESLSLVAASRASQVAWRRQVGVVFQEPAASLNPLQTVGKQLSDVIRSQNRTGDIDVQSRVVELLDRVRLPDPQAVARLRPDQISGGMAQRVMIALALAKEPRLLIADEPTTALDVTVQAEILALLRTLCEDGSFGVLLVTHDIGVAAELADRCYVMFQGVVVESGDIGQVAMSPLHPYTSSLVSAVPQNEPGRRILDEVPSIDGADRFVLAVEGEQVDGCRYRFRCPYMIDECETIRPELDGASPDLQVAACHRREQLTLIGVGR